MRLSGRATGAALVFVLMGCLITPPKPTPPPTSADLEHLIDQADEILDFIEGKTDIMPDMYEAPVEEATSILGKGLSFLSPIETVYAQARGISPETKDIIVSLRERHGELQAVKGKGYAGENNRGYPELYRGDAIEDSEEKNEAQRLIAAETKDRKMLYNEIVRINEHQALNVSTIGRIYAQRRLLRARSGELFQLPPPGDDFDTFKASTPGIRLGEGCAPDAWVTIG